MNRIYRLYREEGLSVRKRQTRRRAALVHMDVFKKTADAVLQREIAAHKTASHQSRDLQAELEKNRKAQQAIIDQIPQRELDRRRAPPALEDMLDRLDEQRENLERQLASAAPVEHPRNDAGKLEQLREEINAPSYTA